MRSKRAALRLTAVGLYGDLHEKLTLRSASPTKPPPYSHPVPTCAPTASGTLGSSETMTEAHSDADRTLP
jgi:hypothetical protein